MRNGPYSNSPLPVPSRASRPSPPASFSQPSLHPASPSHSAPPLADQGRLPRAHPGRRAPALVLPPLRGLTSSRHPHGASAGPPSEVLLDEEDEVDDDDAAPAAAT